MKKETLAALFFLSSGCAHESGRRWKSFDKKPEKSLEIMEKIRPYAVPGPNKTICYPAVISEKTGEASSMVCAGTGGNFFLIYRF